MASKDLITKILLKAQADSSVAKAFQALSKDSENCVEKMTSIGETATKAFKVVGAVVAASGAAIVGIGKASIESYADYEQLVGGVETLFGTGGQTLEEYAKSIGKSADEIKAFQKANGLAVDGIIGKQTSDAIAKSYSSMQTAQDTVLKNANNAYKTAGLSANEYMETVTSFSASLISSLGGDTQKAADYANMALVDMSDNANKMGTDMDSIMHTYQSLSRGQYAMLDNLKLGYGGTKAEMERLLADATKLTGVKYDISNFSDVIQAIHAVQDEMGITGTTAKEASTTIQGSWSALQGSWANLMTGLADPSQDLGELIQNVFDSALVFFEDNLMPRIKEILPRIASAITEFAPLISDVISTLIPPLIPVVINGAITIVKALVSSLPTILSSLMSALPDSVATIVGAIAGVFAGLKILGFIKTIMSVMKIVSTLIKSFGVVKVVLAALGGPVTIVIAIIGALVGAFIALWNKSEKFRNFWIGLWDKIKSAASSVGSWLKNFFTVTIPNAFNAVINFVKGNWQGLLLFIVNPFAGAFKLLYDNCEGFRNIVDKALQWIKNAFNSVIDWFASLPGKIGTWISNIWQKITTWGANLWAKAKEIGSNFVNGVVTFFQQLPYKIGYVIGFCIGKVIQFGQKLWNFVTTTIPQFISGVIQWFAQLPGKIWTWLKNSALKVMSWGAEIGAKGREKASQFITTVVTFFSQLPGRIWTWLSNAIQKVVSWGSNIVSTARQKASEFISAVITWICQLPGRIWTWLSNTVQKVVSWGADLVAKGRQAAIDLFNAIVDKISEIPSKMLELGKNIIQGLWNGISNAKDWLIGQIKSLGGGIVSGIKSALGINSPSKVMADQVGKFLPSGIAVGIQRNMAVAINAVKGMGARLTNTASKISPTISTKVATVGEKIKKFATGDTVTTPQQAIVGDAPETIVPHGNTPRNRSLLHEAAKGVGASIGNKVFNITFAPVINGGNVDENKNMLEEEFEKFKQMMKKYFEEEERLAY